MIDQRIELIIGFRRLSVFHEFSFSTLGVHARQFATYASVGRGLRSIKDKDELATIRVAIDVAERVFTSVRATLRGSQTEWDIACEIERLTRQLGGSGTSFKPIVAVGPRAALPHAVPGAPTIDRSRSLPRGNRKVHHRTGRILLRTSA